MTLLPPLPAFVAVQTQRLAGKAVVPVRTATGTWTLRRVAMGDIQAVHDPVCTAREGILQLHETARGSRQLLKYAAEKLIDGKRTLPEIVCFLNTQLEKNGFAFLEEGSGISCGYAMPRIQEIYSCFNRYRRI